PKAAKGVRGADIGARLVGIGGPPADLKQELGHLLRVEPSHPRLSHALLETLSGPWCRCDQMPSRRGVGPTRMLVRDQANGSVHRRGNRGARKQATNP